MDKAVHLRSPGEPPVWGVGGGHTSIDDDIVAARTWPLDSQRELFFRCARTLYDNRVRDNVDDENRLDPSDNDQWMADLATWLRWSDELRDEVKKEAMRSAVEILAEEMPGYVDPG
jgi:hypothetical protein